jgi:hypothetical protein
MNILAKVTMVCAVFATSSALAQRPAQPPSAVPCGDVLSNVSTSFGRQGRGPTSVTVVITRRNSLYLLNNVRVTFGGAPSAFVPAGSAFNTGDMRGLTSVSVVIGTFTGAQPLMRRVYDQDVSGASSFTIGVNCQGAPLLSNGPG